MRTGFLFHIACLVALCICPCTGMAQDTVAHNRSLQQLRFSGQFSGWMQYTPDVQMDFASGGRYLPQINYRIPFKNKRLLDFEASAHLHGTLSARLFDSTRFDGKIKEYRLWARYSNHRLEVRAGLQKINFGSAQMLRPLMWFDRIDPRDPLQLTNGVWGLLGRYYFNNNANIWFWSLYGNDDPKGYEAIPTLKKIPEAGGRIQLPVPGGEAAATYHYRVTDPAQLFPPGVPLPHDRIGEHKVAFDIKANVVVGLWLEASWSRFNRSLGVFTNQEMITAGTDYTFKVGNGLVTTFEQFIYSYDQNAFEFAHNTTFSALSLLYPINAFDSMSAITYYNWTDNKGYFFVTWQKQLNRLSCYVMGYWNPKVYSLPGQGSNGNRFAGKGIQVMVVWNH